MYIYEKLKYYHEHNQVLSKLLSCPELIKPFNELKSSKIANLASEPEQAGTSCKCMFKKWQHRYLKHVINVSVIHLLLENI